MDILESIDLESKDVSHRVRSWYLYEQFKSLERSQLDAAQKLKDKTFQDRILQQELHERKARRKLCEQFGSSCESESQIPNCTSNCNNTPLSSSTDNFFESFCELQDDERSRNSDHDTDTEEAYSQDDSQTDKRFLEEFKSIVNVKDYRTSHSESVDSIILNTKANKDIADIKKELKTAQRNIAEEINLQLGSVKENIQCLKSYAQIGNDDKISENNSAFSDNEHNLKVVSLQRQESELQLYTLWSKLVSFAYQVIQLNHGNCYYDYSSQFLTAVLACDVLRRGVNKMSNILQPYVSPINYDSDVSIGVIKESKRRSSKLLPKQFPRQTLTENHRTKAIRRHLRKQHSVDDYWYPLSRHSMSFKNKTRFRSSEPWQSNSKLTASKQPQSGNSSNYLWPSFSQVDMRDNCKCLCHVKVSNPMLKIGQYIDRLWNDLDDCLDVKHFKNK